MGLESEKVYAAVQLPVKPESSKPWEDLGLMRWRHTQINNELLHRKSSSLGFCLLAFYGNGITKLAQPYPRASQCHYIDNVFKVTIRQQKDAVIFRTKIAIITK